MKERTEVAEPTTCPKRGDTVRVTLEGVLADPDHHEDFLMNVYRLADGRIFSRDASAIEILEGGH